MRNLRNWCSPRPGSAPPPTGRLPGYCRGRSNPSAEGPRLAQSPGRARFADGVPRHRLGLLELGLVYGGACPPSAEGPPTGGIAATKGANWVTSWRLAPVRMAAKGIPLAPMRSGWRLLPGLRRSVGLGPVYSPTTNRSEGPTIHHGSGPINLAGCSQFGSSKIMNPLPNPPSAEGPITKTTQAGHDRAAPHLLG